jgi:hypothetical protein
MNRFSMLLKLLRGPAGITLIIMLWLVVFFIIWQVLRSKKSKAPVDKPLTVSDTAVHQNIAAAQPGQPLPVSDTAVNQNTTVVQSGQPMPVKSPGLYNAMAFTAEGIIFPKIDKPLGKLIYLDPSIPGGHHGPHYLVRQIKDGTGYEAYDPREKSFDDKETPSRCYKATHVYDLIKNLFANKYGFLDKINYFIIGLSIVCLFFIIIVVIDKWK